MNQPTPISIKPRIPFLSFVLSLILPGLGQVYNGQIKKAAIFFSLLLLISFLFGLTRASTFFYGMLTFVLIQLTVRVYIIVDAVKKSKLQKAYVLKPYNTWYCYLLIALGMIAIFRVLDVKTLLGTQNFKIPTNSNSPTLLMGDLLLVDIRAYKTSEPDYGDFVMFYKDDGHIHTYRVVGRPNDNIELIDNIVSINGIPGRATYIKETTLDDIPVLVFEEELPNGHKHLMYKFVEPFDSTNRNLKNIRVPQDCYYVLGDNRDNAADSRYIGFIRKDAIIGRIMFSYWGKKFTERINIDFTNK